MKPLYIVAALLLALSNAFGQAGRAIKNISFIDQESLIIETAAFLKTTHLDTALAASVGDSLMARLNRGVYQEAANSVDDFVARLDGDIQEVAQDGLSGIGGLPYRESVPWLYCDWPGRFVFRRAFAFTRPRIYFLEVRFNKQKFKAKWKEFKAAGITPLTYDNRRFERSKTMAPIMMPRRMAFSGAKNKRWNLVYAEKTQETGHSFFNFGHTEFRQLPNGASYWRLSYWVTPPKKRHDDKFRAITALANDGRALILDFRGNALGDPQALVYFIAAFLPKGKSMTLGFLKGRDGKAPLKVTRDALKESPKFEAGRPVYVLIDENTAGVSEWAVFLLKKYAGATTIGSRTAGQARFEKSSVLWNGTFSLRAAAFEALDAEGRPVTWGGTGITPDITATSVAALDSAIARCDALTVRETAHYYGLPDYPAFLQKKAFALTAPPLEEGLLAKLSGDYEGGYRFFPSAGALWLAGPTGDTLRFKNAGERLLIAENALRKDFFAPSRLWDNIHSPFHSLLPSKPLFLAYQDGTIYAFIYPDGAVRRIAKTQSENSEAFEAREKNGETTANTSGTIENTDTYDLFADTAKTAERFQAILKEYPAEMENTEAAPFEFTDMEGEYLSSGNFTGNKAVVLNFWFSACAPCVAEMPAFNALKEKYADQDISFIGINRYDDSERILKFLKKHPFDFHIIANDEDQKTAVEKALADYKAVVFPTTVLIGKDGKIKFARAGYLPEYSGMLDRAIKRELGL